MPKRRKPTSELIRTAVVAALTMGKASSREILLRMGIEPPQGIIPLLRQLEREKVVCVVGRESGSRGGSSFIWDLAPIAERAP